jgi:PAS domain-containing protein
MAQSNDSQERRSPEISAETVVKALDGIADGLLVLDHKCVILYANATVQFILGHPLQELLGLPIPDVLAPNGAQHPLAQVCAQVVAKGMAVHTVYRSAARNSWFDVRAMPSDGAVVISLVETPASRPEADKDLADRLASASLDAVDSHICVLDAAATILAVNQAWLYFGDHNGLGWANGGIGANYLSVCDRAQGEGESLAKAAGAGIRNVLSGAAEGFELDYPCNSADVERWFSMRVRPFRAAGSRHAVVAHHDVTGLKKAEQHLRLEKEKAEAAAQRAL